MTTDRNQIRALVEAGLGSDGSTEIAERVTEALVASGGIIFDGQDGYSLVADDQTFWAAVEAAA